MTWLRRVLELVGLRRPAQPPVDVPGPVVKPAEIEAGRRALAHGWRHHRAVVRQSKNAAGDAARADNAVRQSFARIEGRE